MAENGQTTVAWEMLSNVVVMRAKAKENKLPKLLSSLHGVEVELARIIADSDGKSSQSGEFNANARSARLATVTAGAGRAIDALPEIDDLGMGSVEIFRSRTTRRTGGRGDQQLRSHTKKYLAIAQQLSEFVNHGEAVASGQNFGEMMDYDLEATSDSLLAEQHDLTFAISSLKASTFEGLVDKAAVLDDLIEENSDDPVQTLARSLARDVMAMGQSKKAGH